MSIYALDRACVQRRGDASSASRRTFSPSLKSAIRGRPSMKLIRFGPPGREKPGIIDASGRIRDLSGIVPDLAGDVLSPKGLATIRKAKVERLPVVRSGVRIGPCVGHVGNFIAIGLNYADHAAESGQPIPKEPIVFNKAP